MFTALFNDSEGRQAYLSIPGCTARQEMRNGFMSNNFSTSPKPFKKLQIKVIINSEKRILKYLS